MYAVLSRRRRDWLTQAMKVNLGFYAMFIVHQGNWLATV